MHYSSLVSLRLNFWGPCLTFLKVINTDNTHKQTAGIEVYEYLLFQAHCEALHAAGVQREALRQQSLVKSVEGAVVFLQRQSWTHPLDVDHLNPSQQVTDALLQPVRLLEQASVTRQSFKELNKHTDWFTNTSILAQMFAIMFVYVENTVKNTVRLV